MAIITRWRMPPDSSCGYRATSRRRGMPTSAAAPRARAAPRLQARCIRNAPSICRPMVSTGLSEVIGPGRPWRSGAADRPIRGRGGSHQVAALEAHAAGGNAARVGQQAHEGQGRHALAAARFADDAEHAATAYQKDTPRTACTAPRRVSKATVRSRTERSGGSAIVGCPSKNCTTTSKGHDPRHHALLSLAGRVIASE